MIIEGKEIVFVCFENNPYSGLKEVKTVVDEWEEALLFKKEEDKRVRSVEAFVMQRIGSSLDTSIPIEIQNKLLELYNDEN